MTDAYQSRSVPSLSRLRSPTLECCRAGWTGGQACRWCQTSVQRASVFPDTLQDLRSVYGT